MALMVLLYPFPGFLLDGRDGEPCLEWRDFWVMRRRRMMMKGETLRYDSHWCRELKGLILLWETRREMVEFDGSGDEVLKRCA